MFCSNCGTKNDDGSRFCSKCGAPLETVNYGTQNIPVQNQGYQNYNTQRYNTQNFNKQHYNFNGLQNKNIKGPFDSVMFLIAVILTTVSIIISLTQSNIIAQMSSYLKSVELYFNAFGFITTVSDVIVVIASIASIALVISLWMAVLSRFIGKVILNIGATIAHVVLVVYAVMMMAVIVIAVYAVVSVSSLLNMYGDASEIISAMAVIYVYLAVIIAICILFAVFYLKAAKAADKVVKSDGKLICSGFVPVLLIVMAALSLFGIIITFIMADGFTASISSAYGYMAISPGLLLTGILPVAAQIIFAVWIFKSRVKE